MTGDDLDPHLRPLFLKEADALLGGIEAQLRQWQSVPADDSACRRLRHKLHTLKGLSHTVGAHGFAVLIQQTELDAKGWQGRVPDASAFAHFTEACRNLKSHFALLKNPTVSGLEADAATVSVTPEMLGRRLQGTAQQAALELGKRVRLDILGEVEKVSAERLEALAGPLDHLVRNAVVHGIEAPGDRAREGKPAQGEIRLEFRQDGTQLRISVSDDGAGVDYAAVAECARQLGWLDSDAPPEPARLHEFLFRPGFSTTGEVTVVAGLGVGLDAVKAAVEGLGGAIEIESRSGVGTRFIICLTNATAQTG